MTPLLPEGCRIVLFGAPGSGRSSLARALNERAIARGMDRVQAIEQDLAQLVPGVAGALGLPGATGLLGLPGALGASGGPSPSHGPTITLLMALDLPCPPAESLQREHADAELRTALTNARIPFAVIHGRGSERLAAAWNAILARAEAASGESAPVGSLRRDGEPATAGDAANTASAAAARPWTWSCDKCSDPACEHRLFSELMARRD